MRRRSQISLGAAAIATLVLAGSALGASFGNGGLEDANTTIGTIKQVTGNAIPGWKISGAVDWVGTGYWSAPEGVKSVDLNASPTAGALSRTFDTSVNSTYDVGFKLSGNPNCGAGVKTLTVEAGNEAAKTFAYTVPDGGRNGNMGWVDKVYSFVGTGPSATLTFASTTAGNCGPAIDAVTVSETLATRARCKDGGWRSMMDEHGHLFKNQGDCVSYYATDTRNEGAGGTP